MKKLIVLIALLTVTTNAWAMARKPEVSQFKCIQDAGRSVSFPEGITPEEHAERNKQLNAAYCACYVKFNNAQMIKVMGCN